MTRQMVCEQVLSIIKYLKWCAFSCSRCLKLNYVACIEATAELADITAGARYEHGIQRKEENGSANST